MEKERALRLIDAKVKSIQRIAQSIKAYPDYPGNVYLREAMRVLDMEAAALVIEHIELKDLCEIL